MAIEFAPSLISAVSGVLGAGIGGLCSYWGVRANAHAQEKAAVFRIEADLQLQAERLKDANASAEIALRRAKLEELHVFLSQVSAQCSQTQAQLDYQMGRDLIHHATRWNALVDREHIARATVAIYFPGLSDGMASVVSGIEDFNWEVRELLQTDNDWKENTGKWQARYKQIIKFSDDTAGAVSKLKRQIIHEAEHLIRLDRNLWPPQLDQS